MANHVLGHIDLEECTAVVNVERVSNELRQDHAGARPRLDWGLGALLVSLLLCLPLAP